MESIDDLYRICLPEQSLDTEAALLQKQPHPTEYQIPPVVGVSGSITPIHMGYAKVIWRWENQFWEPGDMNDLLFFVGQNRLSRVVKIQTRLPEFLVADRYAYAMFDAVMLFPTYNTVGGRYANVEVEFIRLLPRFSP